VAKYLQDPDDFPQYQDNNNADNEDGEDYNDIRIRARGQERRRMISEIIHEMQD
jgi:hypothetical protein